jgi:mannose-1-phosphate guanylyltransferase
MGSGGALFYAKKSLNKFSSFFAINSDEVMIPPSPQILADLAEHFQKTKALATLLVTDHPELQKTLKPVWINAGGIIRGFGEKPKLKEKLRPVHYTGYKIFSNDVLALLPKGESHIFHDTLVPAMNRGALVNTLFVDCHWWETGSLEGLLRATADCTKMVHSSPQKNHLQKVYNNFQKEFSFLIKYNTKLQLAVDRTSTVNTKLCKNTVFVGAHSDVDPEVSLNHCIIDKNIKITQNIQNTLVLNKGD